MCDDDVDLVMTVAENVTLYIYIQTHTSIIMS